MNPGGSFSCSVSSIASETTPAEVVTAATIELTGTEVRRMVIAAKVAGCSPLIHGMYRAASAMVSAQIGPKRPGLRVGIRIPSFRNFKYDVSGGCVVAISYV